MKRSLGIALAVVAATGIVALGAGTAFAEDNSGPFTLDNQSETGTIPGADKANFDLPEGIPTLGK